MKLDGGDNLLRIVDPDNDISYWESWILCDDGVKRSFIVHNSVQGASILGKIIGDVKFFNKGGILETKKGETGQKEWKWNSIEDPEIIELVRCNGDKSNPMETGWKPKQKFAFNVIDRKDNWCKENKKTKILKIGSGLGGKFVLIEENNGPVDQYDINIVRSGQGMTGTKYEPNVPGAFAKDKFPNIVFGPISEEEQSYAKWDLKAIAGNKSATSVLTYLRNLITRVGKVMGIDFIAMLEAQSEAEKEVWNANKEAGTSSESASSETFNDSAVPFNDAVSPSTRAPQASTVLIECPKCKTMNPDNAEKCSNCQVVLLLACDSCHQMMSAFAEECPNCKARYKVG
jgi:hypothetical protein